MCGSSFTARIARDSARSNLTFNEYRAHAVPFKSAASASSGGDSTKPFSLAKDPAQAKRLDEVLYNLAETCRVLAVLLWPFLPGTAVKIYQQLGLTGIPDKLESAVWGGLNPSHTIGEPSALFPRKDAPPQNP